MRGATTVVSTIPTDAAVASGVADDGERERAARLARLAAAHRLLGRFGMSEGVAGHLTVRDPVHPDRFWAAPYGMHFSLVREEHLVCTDAAGRLHVGDRPAHPAAIAIHGAVHDARPDVVSAGHVHSDAGRAVAALEDCRILPLTQDACAFFEDLGVLDDYGGVATDAAEGARIAAALGPHKAVILRNHGLLTVGGSVDEMVWWMLSLEKVCRVQLDAMQAGAVRPLPLEIARETASAVGSPGAALLNAAPLFDWIDAEPDAGVR
jgi:ribulose-5-phosphate 4-epimerase/fuculose-1-phosphate aldolase